MNAFSLIVFSTLLALPCPVLQEEVETSDKDRRDPTVGAGGWISQIILPGSQLRGKPMEATAPIAVRIADVFPHGDSFRYDIQFNGFEPGKYNIADWLQREDGSSTDDLPEIIVEVRSLLPPGQIEPNQVQLGWLPRLGGYRALAALATLLWLAILGGLIFLGRKKPEELKAVEHKVTLAELLEPRLQAAKDDKMQPEQYAELERMLFGFWRQRLGLDSEAAESALTKIHADDQAGPLMKQLEQWMHNPGADRSVDLSSLLEPYRNMPAEELETSL